MCTCDRVSFAIFSALFSLVGQNGVSECEVGRIFASRRSGGRRSAHGMATVMAGIYSSFSANRDGRRRPWLRECQLFFHFFSRILWSCVRGEREDQKKLTKKHGRRRGAQREEIFTLLEPGAANALGEVRDGKKESEYDTKARSTYDN